MLVRTAESWELISSHVGYRQMHLVVGTHFGHSVSWKLD
jgi:hypothetical protein